MNVANFSQRDEQPHILNYFGDNVGRFLEIGTYHPETFSNVRALYLQGWKGTMVEPSPALHATIDEYYGDDEEMEFFKVAIAGHDGEITFYDSNGDAISSTDKAHADLWAANYGANFTEITVPCITIETLLERSKYDTFDFINIDCEGMDLEILKQIDLHAVGCDMVCIEHNGADTAAFLTAAPGFSVIHKTPENIILAR